MADVDVDTCRPHSIERGLFPEVAAGDLVAHLGEHDGDGAHPRPADADDVEPQPPREVDRGNGRGDG